MKARNILIFSFSFVLFLGLKLYFIDGKELLMVFWVVLPIVISSVVLSSAYYVLSRH